MKSISMYIVFALLAALFVYTINKIIPSLHYDDCKETLSALLNISSIIFAIIGAWIAVIYPKAMGRVFKNLPVKNSELDSAENDEKYLTELVSIVLVSAAVLMSVLILQFSTPIFKKLINKDLLIYGKYAFIYIVTFLTMTQLYAVSRVVLTNYFFSPN